MINLAVIPGDGIGPEVTAEALKVLRAAIGSDQITETEYSIGAEHWLKTGETLTEETLASLKTHDAILFGAVGADPRDTRIPSGILEREILLKLRFDLDHGINFRPAVLYPGVSSPLADPGAIDFVVFREGTEGLYAGQGGRFKAGTRYEIANEVSVNTAFGVERVVRAAFEYASTARERKHVTLVHKHNVLVHAGKLWQRIVDQVAEQFPEVTHDYLHVDAATIFMTTDPTRFDVIVTDNMFGDIITDLAAAVTGGIGMAASGNISTSGTPSMFEPVHGSAPDIAGTQQADPTAAILSAAILLEYSDRADAAQNIRDAVWADLADKPGKRSTAEIGDAIAGRL